MRTFSLSFHHLVSMYQNKRNEGLEDSILSTPIIPSFNFSSFLCRITNSCFESLILPQYFATLSRDTYIHTYTHPHSSGLNLIRSRSRIKISVDSDMNSAAPAGKSQPLHNFNFPCLNWNRTGESSRHNPTRSRYTNAPLRKHVPLRDSASVPSFQHQSPMRDSAPSSALESMDCLAKRSPVRGGESSKPVPVRELAKEAPVSGESVRNLVIGGESVSQFPKLGFTEESEDLGKSKGVCVEKSEGLGRSKSGLIEYKRKRSRNSEQAVEKLEKKVEESDATVVKRPKLVIKFHCKNNPEKENKDENKPEEVKLKIDSNKENIEVQEEGKMDNHDEESKKWNLRPRKQAGMKALPDKNKAPSPLRTVNNRSVESERNSGGNGGGGKKRKLSILVALTKREIEEDMFSMIGSMPSRRPRKRTKNVQKQVELVSPGMWLVDITPDSYKVSERSMKA